MGVISKFSGGENASGAVTLILFYHYCSCLDYSNNNLEKVSHLQKACVVLIHLVNWPSRNPELVWNLLPKENIWSGATWGM